MNVKAFLFAATASVALAIPAAADHIDCRVVFDELIALHKASGPQAVIDELNKPGGKYEQLNEYIVIYNTDGVALGISPEHSYAGMNLYDMQSDNGIYMIREYIKLAAQGGGKVPNIQWPDSKTGNMLTMIGYASGMLDDKHFLACTDTDND